MYHDNRGSLSAYHTLLSNMYHDNRGSLSAYHTLLSNMYHDNRGRLSAHHTHCYLTCTMITEVGSVLTAPCYLTCEHDNRGRLLDTTPCCLTSYLLCIFISALARFLYREWTRKMYVPSEVLKTLVLFWNRPKINMLL